jgi:hypothetical protein
MRVFEGERLASPHLARLVHLAGDDPLVAAAAVPRPLLDLGLNRSVHHP